MLTPRNSVTVKSHKEISQIIEEVANFPQICQNIEFVKLALKGQ